MRRVGLGLLLGIFAGGALVGMALAARVLGAVLGCWSWSCG